MRVDVVSCRQSFVEMGCALSRMCMAALLVVGGASAAWLSPNVGKGFVLMCLLFAALVDLRVGRVPDVVVGSSLAVVAVVSFAVGQPLSAFVGAAVCSGPLLLLHLASPSWCEFGDVKFAVPLGAVTALLSARPVGGSLLLLMIASAVFVATCIASGRARLPFAPALIVGAIAALLGAPSLFTHAVIST